MPVVHINCGKIHDWESFHIVFSETLGFPAFYGRNMNAWIDCLTSLDSPDDGLTTVHCKPFDVLTIQLDDVILLPDEVYEAIQDCAAFVNWRRLQVGESAVVAISCNRDKPVK